MAAKPSALKSGSRSLARKPAASRSWGSPAARQMRASSRWAGVPDSDEAAPVAIVAYFGAYGPATLDAFGNWLAGGWFGKRKLRTWFGALGDRLAEVDVEGERAHVLAEDLDELASGRPSTAVRLLPGFDQYVMGPGTDDGHVVRASRRAVVSKQSGWISPVVLAGGAVCGTWGLAGERLLVAWFKEAGAVRRTALQAEVERLATIVERRLKLEVSVA